MATTRRSPLTLDTYDPFAAASSSSSFLPPMGLFSPVAPSPFSTSASSSSLSARQTPNFCATIFEEEDNDGESEASSSTITPTPEYQRRQSAFSFAIHPRILRTDSCSSDDDSDIPPVLRFPVPPSTIPNRSPPKRTPALKPVTIPPPQPELKSCFEDDDDDDDVVVAPSPSSSRRGSPTRLTTPISSRPSPAAASSKSFSLLKKATNVLKSSTSSSPPHRSSSPAAKVSTSTPSTPVTEKPLPKVPHAQRPRITPAPYYEDQQQPISVSPTPSLSSSSSSSECSSTVGYIPVGSIIPAPAIVQDLDEYLETLEMYFPSELWEEQPHELRRKPNNIAKSRGSSSSGAAHRKHRSAESSSESSSSCSRSSSDENLRRRKSDEVPVALDVVNKLLKNSASSGNMKIASYTTTSSTSVRVSSPLSPPADIHSHSRSGSATSSDSPTSTAFSLSSSPSNSSSTIMPGSRTPSPTLTKTPAALLSPKSILKPSKSTPLLRNRSTSSAAHAQRSYYDNVPMSPTRGRPPVAMSQLFSAR